MATQTASLASLAWQPYAANSKDLIAPVAVDLNTYASVTVTPVGAAVGVASQIQGADGVVVDNMQGTSDLMVQIGPVLELVPRYQKTVIPLFPGSPNVIFSGAGIIPRVYFYVGTFRGVGNNLNAFASNQAANVASITGGTVDAYLHTLRWQINYQLNNGFNLDNIIDSGFYDVLNPVNSGTSLPAGTWQINVQVYSGSPLFQYQLARNIVAGETQVFERRCVVGVWTPWREIGRQVTGQCQFVYINATTCRLNPVGGGLLLIAGNVEMVSAGGVNISNMIGASALAASTLYFAYAYMSAPGVMALEWSTTSFALDAKGNPIKSGDPSRTCVGMCYTDAAGKFQDSIGFRGVATYFNRTLKFASMQGTSYGTSSTSPVLAAEIPFLSWGDAAGIRCSGYAFNNTAQTSLNSACGLNGAVSGPLGLNFTSFANVAILQYTSTDVNPNIGVNKLGVFVWVNAGAGTWNLITAVSLLI